MSGLLRRIRRPGAAEETRTEPLALPDPAHGSAPAAPAAGEDGQRLPAGVAPEDVERREVSGRRGKLRRRARFLHKARELALRDLGGLVYEARRREQDPGKLAQDKVDKLIALDAELNEIEAALGVVRGQTVVREPGVGGTCARCGELHASDAVFCSRCGANLAEATREAAAAEAERRAAAEKAAAEKAAAQKAEADKAAAEKAEADKAAAEKAEADKAEAEKTEADKAKTDMPAAEQAAGEKAAGEKAVASKAAADQPTAAHDAAEQPTEAQEPAAEDKPAAEQPTEAHDAPENPGAGNGHIDSEAPTEVAEPATSRDRSA
jgi:hypothetical protein